MNLTRRRFLRSSAAGLFASQTFHWSGARAATAAREVRFGLCADIHKDIIQDADSRLQTFIDDMSDRKLDFILDLGDFCQPRKRNQAFLDIFNAYEGTKYHVLGNHEIDGGFRWQQAMDFFGMEAPHYSFDVGGYHFVVLDGNNKPEGHTSGYPRYINEEQLAWLEADLANTEQPTIVFSHQGLYDSGGGMVENYADVQRLLESAPGKVIACLNGHRHVDEHREEKGIHYLAINSMAYYWVGNEFQHARYSDAIEAAHPNLKNTIPYDTPLYTVVTIRPSGELLLEGRSGAFVPPTPVELGVPKNRSGGTPITASISNRTITTRK